MRKSQYLVAQKGKGKKILGLLSPILSFVLHSAFGLEIAVEA